MPNNKKGGKLVADALNDCFESMLADKDSIESCLARYPEFAEELKPLLNTMQTARAASRLSPEASFRARARYEFRSALSESTSSKARPVVAWRWQWATMASTVGVLLIAVTGGIISASSGSMPGQPLYQVKRTIENVQLTLAPSQSSKARLYATLADRRVGEIVYAAQLGDVKLTENLTQQFSYDMGMVSAIAEPTLSPSFGGASKQAGAPSVNSSLPMQSSSTTIASGFATDVTPSALTPPPVTATAAPAVTSAVSTAATPPVIVTQVAPTQNAVLPSSTVSLSGINDPALLKLLQQYSVKNVAELMSVMDNVPPSTKTALLAAIQAVTAEYGQILGT